MRIENKGIDLNINSLIMGIVLGVALLMGGCSSKKLYVKNSGFFKDYEQLNKQIKPKGFQIKDKSDAILSSYKYIMVAPVQVISSIAKEQQSESQKKLYKEISEYLAAAYKKEVLNASGYILTDSPSENTLILQTAVSTVEVHFDDSSWYQFSSVPMGLTVVSYNVYLDEDVRILGEKRLVDSQTGKVLERSMNIVKDIKITLDGANLELSNLKPALDAWLDQLSKDLKK